MIFKNQPKSAPSDHGSLQLSNNVSVAPTGTFSNKARLIFLPRHLKWIFVIFYCLIIFLLGLWHPLLRCSRPSLCASTASLNHSSSLKCFQHYVCYMLNAQFSYLMQVQLSLFFLRWGVTVFIKSLSHAHELLICELEDLF